jgi:hypothetical protein
MRVAIVRAPSRSQAATIEADIAKRQVAVGATSSAMTPLAHMKRECAQKVLFPEGTIREQSHSIAGCR